MRLVLKVFCKEFFSISQVVFSARGLSGEGGHDTFGMSHLQGAVNLVGGDVVESFSFEFLRQALPIKLCGLEEAEGAHHVGLRKGEGVFDGAVHMALGSEVDDAVDVLVLHQFVHAVEVTNVHADELVVRLIFDILEIGEVAGVGQLVEVDNPVLRVLVDKQPYHMASDESGTSGDDDVHIA